MIGRSLAVALAALALAAPAASEEVPEPAWGEAAHGLRIGLSATAHEERLRGVTLTLQLENTTEGPLRVPGRLRLPWNWLFEFTPRAGGPTLLAHFAQPPEPPEPPSPIELDPGQRFELRFDCRHWIRSELRTIARPTSGAHEILAASAPVGAEPDQEAWTGEAHSGAVEVEIAFRDPLATPESPEPSEAIEIEAAPEPEVAPLSPAPVEEE